MKALTASLLMTLASSAALAQTTATDPTVPRTQGSVAVVCAKAALEANVISSEAVSAFMRWGPGPSQRMTHSVGGLLADPIRRTQ